MKKLSIIALLMAVVSLLFWQPQMASADELSGHAHENGLRYLISKNALVTDANGSYRPNDNVTRGEFASYLAKVMNLEANNGMAFTDVPDTYVYAKELELLLDTQTVHLNLMQPFQDSIWQLCWRELLII